MVRPQRVRLGELLVSQGLMTDEQLNSALEEQKRNGRKLGQVVMESGYVSEDVIAKTLAKQLKAPYVDLKSFTPQPDLIKLLPESAARRHRAIVLDVQDDLLVVGFSDPTDLTAFDEITRIVRRDILAAVVLKSQLLATIDRVYRRTEEISGLAKELTDDMSTDIGEFGALFGQQVGLEDAPVVKLLNSVFEEALKMRASDIHIEPQEKNLVIRFRIDGVLHVQMTADSKIASAVALRLKIMSGLDISEKRLPQDGRFNIKLTNSAVDVRMSTLPTQYGESVVMRLLSQSSEIIGLDKMNIPAQVLDRLRNAIHRPSGMVLVTGPTGSGKTTTLYAALSELNSPEKKILTAEDPVEYRLPGINQVQIYDKIDLTFARVLRSALRQDPDIILVGEMRDQETAEIGMRAAMTGHMVLSTLHTNDALSTPIRLLDMGVPRFMVALSLQLVLAQRLVRVVCPDCKETYKPTPHEHEWLRLELGNDVDAHVYHKGIGCTQCNNTGYIGRQGIYEYLEMTNALVEAANHGDPTEFMRIGREQMAGNTLRRDAVNLVLAGRSTIEEAMRINNILED
jgi:MSHA biogenesis protein MshE